MSRTSSRYQWGADVPISKPLASPDAESPQVEVVDLGGLVFGPMGLMVPISQAAIEQRYSPVWGPALTPNEEVQRRHG